MRTRALRGAGVWAGVGRLMFGIVTLGKLLACLACLSMSCVACLACRSDTYSAASCCSPKLPFPHLHICTQEGQVELKGIQSERIGWANSIAACTACLAGSCLAASCCSPTPAFSSHACMRKTIRVGDRSLCMGLPTMAKGCVLPGTAFGETAGATQAPVDCVDRATSYLKSH